MLTDTQKGDRVAIVRESSVVLAIVTRTTATIIVVGPDRYRRRDGRWISWQEWNRPTLSLVTPDLLARVGAQFARRDAAAAVTPDLAARPVSAAERLQRRLYSEAKAAM